LAGAQKYFLAQGILATPLHIPTSQCVATGFQEGRASPITNACAPILSDSNCWFLKTTHL